MSLTRVRRHITNEKVRSPNIRDFGPWNEGSTMNIMEARQCLSHHSEARLEVGHLSEAMRIEASGGPTVGRVVVGVDASEESKEALRWAARYATFIGARLEVVHALHPAEEHAWIQTLPPPAEPTEVAGKALAQLVEEVVGSSPASDVRTAVIKGHAVKVLTEMAKGASLLVVGNRGLGGFDGMLLGSTSEKCAAHAPCSVVIVRLDEAE